ncbi:sodium:calcium antiporter [Sorangium cellulosum]|uniref:Sodium:calcium antiporter n=1 Tax=Sorangium cellulosum TaxID=56 RepID=A0A4P2Q055_SORCE|nr:calcium/sodium antiporter [Sorangium cellulosum]AUX22510.1 sodium:calcium antiporter [Sorangium cellulosum]
MLLHAAQLVLGAVSLYFGAEWLVKGASGLALSLGLRPLVVGLTVVAYGTSAPELIVSLAAVLEGRGAVALGNAVGSNIANLGLILGVTALISPPRVAGGLIWREVPFLVGTAALVPLLLLDGGVDRLEGALLCAASIGYTVWVVRSARTSAAGGAAAGARPPEPSPDERGAFEAAREMEVDAERAGAPGGRGTLRLALIAAVGLGLLVVGGKVFVDGAVGVALGAGMSERVVGLTIVAVGTSLPELATSLIAAARGHADIAVGNVVGSNIFNVLLILGGAALVGPLAGSPGAMAVDLITLGGVTAFAAVAMRTERSIRRTEGATLLTMYTAFLVALVLAG